MAFGPDQSRRVALIFGIVSFVIAEIVIVSLHVKSAQLTHEAEEIQLAHDLYREFNAAEKPPHSGSPTASRAARTSTKVMGAASLTFS
ncbi:MAG: hypothetical protein ACREDO_12965 [Methyloceanibacter sp.]